MRSREIRVSLITNMVAKLIKNVDEKRLLASLKEKKIKIKEALKIIKIPKN